MDPDDSAQEDQVRLETSTGDLYRWSYYFTWWTPGRRHQHMHAERSLSFLCRPHSFPFHQLVCERIFAVVPQTFAVVGGRSAERLKGKRAPARSLAMPEATETIVIVTQSHRKNRPVYSSSEVFHFKPSPSNQTGQLEPTHGIQGTPHTI